MNVPSRYAWSRIVTVIAATVMASMPPLARADSNMMSLNKKDGVKLTKITPRTLAELPVPMNDFIVYFELKILLRSSPRGTVDVSFYRRANNRLYPLATAVKLKVKGSKRASIFALQSPPITIHSARPGDQLYIRARLRDAGGNDVSWSDSVNPLRGNVSVRPATRTATADDLTALPGTSPAPGTALPTDTPLSFVIRLNYSVRAVRRGIINVEFGELSDVRQGREWTASVVEVPRGTGQVEIRRTFRFPSALAGRKMVIGYALRLDPLGGSVVHKEVTFFPITR